MHAKLEIIMPPTDDIEKSIETIMKPFSECEEDSDHPFWDFYVIGGRWAGTKITDSIDKVKMDQFFKSLTDTGITVSGFTAGKQTLSPASQIPAVDALWRDIFPDSPFDQCPIFDHANDKYDSKDTLPGDIVLFKDLSESTVCSRLIIATIGYEDKLQAEYMCSCSIWNGVNHEDTAWDGTVKSALERYAIRIERYSDEYKERNTIKEDWLVITVDYHN